MSSDAGSGATSGIVVICEVTEHGGKKQAIALADSDNTANKMALPAWQQWLYTILQLENTMA